MNSAVCMTISLESHPLISGTEAFGLQTPDAYAYTSLSNCLYVPGIDDSKDFADTIVSILHTCIRRY